VVNLSAADWTHWRGPWQNGVSPDKNLPERWSPNPNATDNNLIWKAPYGGRSTPLILNGRVYLINKAGEGIHEQERVMCFDADNGKVLWEYKFNVWLTDIVSDRLGWTNPAADPETGNIYAHGTQGLLLCFDKDGKVLWSRSMHEEYGRISGYGGRVTSPIVDEDLVILSMLNASWGEQARGGNRVVAFDKRTGAVVWWASTGGQPKDTYYSCPVVAEIAGQRLLITGGGDGGVHAFKVRTGEKVWSSFFGTAAVNCSPVVAGTRVYIGHGEENSDTNAQGRVVCLDAAAVTDGHPRQVWKIDGLKARFCSPIIHEGRLYICDEIANLYCIDADTGKEIWKISYGRNSRGSPVLADGKIYVGEVDSRFHILKPGPNRCERLHQQFFRQAGGVDVEIQGSPAVANGRVYLQTSHELYCIGKKDGVNVAMADRPGTPQPAANPVPIAPAHLQIVPADLVLAPGESITLKARLFDDHGNFLKETPAQWSVAPMLPPPPLPNAPPSKGPTPPVLKGGVSPEGKLTVDKVPNGQFGGVVATAAGLTGRARVRVTPQLPLTQDFEQVPPERTPGGWVNCQGKFAVREENGNKFLVKLAVNPSPLVARANAFLGLPSLTNYTIQADILGKKVREDMPDVGVVANRYTLMLAGNTQQLRLISWDAVPRVDKTIPFEWKPNVWYRMKLTAAVEGDKATIRGKVWPRDQEEPKAWTVEFVDPNPNREGSPALYGYASGILEGQVGAEIYYDNVSVKPNGK
jgi:outer membrane protein assembly factor BamB